MLSIFICYVANADQHHWSVRVPYSIPRNVRHRGRWAFQNQVTNDLSRILGNRHLGSIGQSLALVAEISDGGWRCERLKAEEVCWHPDRLL